MADLLGRYSRVIITIIVFLSLVLSVLGLNFYSSFQIEETAEAVNIAGRQRMLSQRTAKALSNLNANFIANNAIEQDLLELASSSSLFDQSLRAFTQGGSTLSTKSGDAILEAAVDPQEKRILEQANGLWGPFFNDISTMIDLLEAGATSLEKKQSVAALLTRNVRYANANINTLLALMNDLTNFKESIAAQSADQSRLIQALGIIASLVCFSIIMFLIFGQLRHADRRAIQARRETKQIFETVDQGLFLVNSDLKIGSEHSLELERIFSSSSMAGQNFKDFISHLVSQADLSKVQRYLKLLFDPHKKQRLLKDLNPLNELPIQIHENGHVVDKYLRFSFSRVMDEGKIEGVLTSVADISTEIKLAKDLEKESKRNEQQLEMISALMGADADLLPEFIDSSNQAYADLNGILRNPARSNDDFKQKADSLMALIHSVKGESAALGLHLITETCHEFETNLDELKQKPVIAGDDFIALTVLLERLISTNEQIMSVFSVIADRNNRGSQSNPNQNKMTQKLFELSQQVSGRQNKQVVLSVSGFDHADLDTTMKKEVQSLASQLLRNAISHGIELPDERIKVGKRPSGQILLALYQDSSGVYRLICEDDGRGIDFDRLAKKAQQTGLITSVNTGAVQAKLILNIMLSNRLSSKDSVDIDAGRGAGMTVIGEIIGRLGAKISLQTRQGRNTRFMVSIPVSNGATTPQQGQAQVEVNHA